MSVGWGRVADGSGWTRRRCHLGETGRSATSLAAVYTSEVTSTRVEPGWWHLLECGPDDRGPLKRPGSAFASGCGDAGCTGTGTPCSRPKLQPGEVQVRRGTCRTPTRWPVPLPDRRRTGHMAFLCLAGQEELGGLQGQLM
eukprot:CAMPEP_0119117098 /NCGR_PEP_ID=MMETSP1180-20130426/52650_1 /TAXON_ID=3052 ORGANISM="Chlamydomonas cf sp, Strain CCMP681" /NCGR_SAMPLE_ID=MMETSP1180 /ASSEMBLY_ACC=CAM_ASM_000741 /LENGTH=140 /DNA_ID=CAMNT_0007106315 /DNA_START=930 /DNA_END=1353 /DNA_ORIENTATION=-